MIPIEFSTGLFYDPIFLGAFTFLVASVFFVTRSRWLPLLQAIQFRINPFRPLQPAYYRLSNNFGFGSRNGPDGPDGDLESGFYDDMRSGLSSRHFDLGTNVAAGDARQGLDTAAKEEIKRIMDKNKRIGFDEARKLYFQKKMKDNGIGPDGMPNDPKALVFR